jgi:uncharacterized protein (UPF0332 family)
MTLRHQRLIRIATAKASTIRDWREGVSLEADGGRTISELCLEVAEGRWRLARELRSAGTACLRGKRKLPRDAISRFYYSLYHSMRAVAFVHYSGDDHESHKELPTKVPSNFPDHAHWANQLKSARDYRNRADYDPFPRGASHWLPIASMLKRDVDQVLPLARDYLNSHGCTLP